MVVVVVVVVVVAAAAAAVVVTVLVVVFQSGNCINVSIYNQVSDTPARGHNLWHGQ